MPQLTVGAELRPSSFKTSAAAGNQFFLATGFGLVLMNCLAFAYHSTGVTIFNVVSNACSLLLVAYSVFIVLTSAANNSYYKIVAVLACSFACVSFIFNFAVASLPDTLKYVSIYTFYLAGQTGYGPVESTEKRCIYILGTLPFLFLLTGGTKIYVGWEYPDVFSYFPNTNTAALYFYALFFALSSWLGTRVLILQFLAAALMNRVGPALGTIISICIWSVFPLRREVIVAFMILGLGCICAYTFGALDRLMTGLDSIGLIWSIGPSSVARMSYKELVVLTGTTDVSAFFRVIHWWNIWELYTSQGWGVIFFGYGSGQTAYIANVALPPHNDYLRILAEYGLFSCSAFVVFVLSILASLKQKVPRILFTVLLIYFFSENLVDNFTSMALFFSYAGRCTANRFSPRAHI